MSGDKRRSETWRICDFSHKLNFAIFALNCTLFCTTFSTRTGSQHVSMVKQQMVSKAFYSAFQFQRTPLQKAESQNHHSIVQLLQKNDARPSLHQPVRYQIVSLFQFPFCQTFFQKTFFYVFTNNVERYTLSDEFFPLLYVRHLTFFLVFPNINFIIRLRILVGKGPEFFQWFQNNTPFEDSKILSTFLSPIVTIVMPMLQLNTLLLLILCNFFFQCTKKGPFRVSVCAGLGVVWGISWHLTRVAFGTLKWGLRRKRLGVKGRN